MTKRERLVLAAALLYWKHHCENYQRRNLNVSLERRQLFLACAALTKAQK